MNTLSLSFLFFLTKKIIYLIYINYGDTMKRFKFKKRNRKYKYILIIISILYIINSNLEIEFKESKKHIIDYVFKSDINYDYKNNIINKIYSGINTNIFNNPINILNTNRFNNVVLVSNISYIENKPKVYIYNSHQAERYSGEYFNGTNITPDVLLASSLLKEKLDSIGIKTIIENNNILEYMSANGLNHGGSYIASRHFLEKVYNEYPNLDLYIDLHRDSISYNDSITNINGKICAKVLFVIGLENPNFMSNLSVTESINNIILSEYPNLTRGILKKEGYGVNGVYNQDLNSNVILIEVGGEKNNMDEVNNTLELIAKVIERYIYEKEKI